MRHRVCITHVYETEGGRITFEIEGVISAFHRGTYYDPPEGGCLDDWNVKVIEAEYLHPVNGYVPVVLTDKHKLAVERAFHSAVGGILYDEINSRMCEMSYE